MVKSSINKKAIAGTILVMLIIAVALILIFVVYKKCSTKPEYEGEVTDGLIGLLINYDKFNLKKYSNGMKQLTIKLNVSENNTSLINSHSLFSIYNDSDVVEHFQITVEKVSTALFSGNTYNITVSFDGKEINRLEDITSLSKIKFTSDGSKTVLSIGSEKNEQQSSLTFDLKNRYLYTSASGTPITVDKDYVYICDFVEK